MENGSGGSDPSSFFTYNDKIYFAANDGINGNEPWISDGTDVGSSLISDLAIDETSSEVNNYFVFNDELYFTVGGTSNPGLYNPLAYYYWQR